MQVTCELVTDSPAVRTGEIAGKFEERNKE